MTGTGLTASFVYDGDGARVKSTINGVTTFFVGNYYEKSGSTITKYYFAGTSRIAMRTGNNVSYLLSDHLGSTSITTDSAGNKLFEQRYKPWGETRFPTPNTGALTQYQYTGQFSYESNFGLYFYNARWYDPALGRFAQADSIVPGGVQGYDRYAYVKNNPLRYTDPTGHKNCEEDGYCPNSYPQSAPSTPTQTPTRTPTPTRIPLPTPTGSPNSKEVAISYLQYSPLGKGLYDQAVASSVKIDYNRNNCGGSRQGGTITISPCYSATYDAGTIAHEMYHFLKNTPEGYNSEYEEYMALLIGDIVRKDIIQAGFGSPKDMRHSIDVYTVDLDNPNKTQLENDLKNWFKNYDPDPGYLGLSALRPTPTSTPTLFPTP